MTRRPEILRSLAALLLGALVFAAGVEAARRWLPEWHGELPEREVFLRRAAALAREAGLRPDVTVAELVTSGESREERGKEMDAVDTATAVARGEGLWVRVIQRGILSGDGRRHELDLSFSPDGFVRFLRLDAKDGERSQRPRIDLAQRRDAFARLLLRPGETLGAKREGNLPGKSEAVYTLEGSDPPWHLSVEVTDDGDLNGSRRPGEIEPRPGGEEEDSVLSTVLQALFVVIPFIAGALTAVGLFLSLLARRRIDLAHGAILAAAGAAGSLASLFPEPTWRDAGTGVVPALFLSLWGMMIWSTGESFLRSLQPGLAVSLDALWAGRLGPRGGRALLNGLALGAILAGVYLGALAIASALPGAWPEERTVQLPFFRGLSPYLTGLQIGGAVALALGLGLRFLPRRWAVAGAALAAGIAIPFVTVRPLTFHVAANIAIAGALVLLCRRQGLAALLAAAFSFALLPVAAFSGLHPDWLALPFTLTATPLALFLVFGFVGLKRPVAAESERIKPPAFMRRMEDERRLKYEMDLLSRMQLGLLPDKLPEIPGWEIAARSLIATEAGGDLYDFIEDEEGMLWIAAGDVAGHGYSCAIVQAMTTAALSSLVSAEKTPSDVLRGVDRVIRRGAARRNFTSLALLRLDPRTGEASLANAGHPYPFLAANGDAVEIPLSGLPLGQGPERTYRDHRFEIPPGGTLVFCSDGLFEATDDRQAPYGFDRPRDLLRSLGALPASGILEALFADWHRHLKAEEPPDDTTVVVVRRAASA